MIYRVAWIFYRGRRRESDLTFSRDGVKYHDVSVAIEYAERRNRQEHYLEFCVICESSRQIVWQKAGSLIPEDSVATTITVVPKATPISQTNGGQA